MQEEELKNRIGERYFAMFDTNRIIGKIDFCVSETVMEIQQSLLWAEAKQGNKHDIFESLVQLILTIGRDQTYTKEMPPKFLGAFDEEKMAFIEYSDIQHVFSQNDFNWNVAPSDHTTKEFIQLYDMVGECLISKSLRFNYSDSDTELRAFIKDNFVSGQNGCRKIQVDRNNFVHVFNQWLAKVKPTIHVKDWEVFNKSMIMSADFFLADLMSEDNKTIVEKLRVLLEYNHYKLKIKIENNDLFDEAYKDITFTDGQKSHAEFWNIYERPPKEVYRDYILERRDLLVPQNIREQKGAFFTPQKWVELGQRYIADTFGEEWQDEYYVWDCCAGTGNLLVGLTNKYNIYASTLDQADVDVMRERSSSGANLLEANIFQMDFLNDEFDKCPEDLRKILNDPKKREKLVIFINPPYAEGDNRKGTGRKGVAVTKRKKMEEYDEFMGYAKREVYIKFLTRIYQEIKGCKLCFFSTLKNLQASKFKQFRENFDAKLKSVFLVPADSFDNVNGQFPISFQIWDTVENGKFNGIWADVYSANGDKLNKKRLFSYDSKKFINEWAETFICDGQIRKCESIGNIIGVSNDFQHQRTVCIERPWKPWNHQFQWQIAQDNLLKSCVYFSVRLCIAANWLNDRDQFLYPKRQYENDILFQTDCLTFTLFHSQNRITSEDGTNHWIPFTEKEVNPKRRFKSHFMTDFIKYGYYADFEDDDSSDDDNGGNGNAPASAADVVSSPIQRNRKKKVMPYMTFDFDFPPTTVCEPVSDPIFPLSFSDEAKAVFDAGRELWTYYHKQNDSNPDASFYDIRKHFQGTNANGSMNAESDDAEYTRLIGILKEKMSVLAKNIEAKVYEYEFLK